MVRGTHEIEIRLFERGVGETESSGTGSCASAVSCDCERQGRFAGDGDCAGRLTDCALGRSSLSSGSGDSCLPRRILRLTICTQSRFSSVQIRDTSQTVKIEFQWFPPLRIRESSHARSVRGDKVGIVAPASNVKREMLEAGCDAFAAAGYEPFYFEVDPRSRSLLCRLGRSAARANWKTCSCATISARSSARVEDMGRTICCRRTTRRVD